MQQYTDTDRARAIVHESRANEWITQEEYEARLRELNDQNDQNTHSVAIAIALLIGLVLTYVALTLAGVL